MINLEKGQRLEVDYKHISVGLGWSPSTSTGVEYDLDASAFMIGVNKKMPKDEYFVFYNNLESYDGAVVLSGDDRTGGSNDGGDDETITVDLSKINGSIEEIIFVASIYEAKSRKQNFGQVHDSYIRIYDADTNVEIAKYALEEDFSIENIVEFGRLYRYQGKWKFEALGIGYKGGLQELLQKYSAS